MQQGVSHEAGVQEVWWNPAEWPAWAAFLVGMPVGFLFRPLQSSEPVPLSFSLWGAWWVPVVVLGGLMWLKIAAVLFEQRKRPTFWRVAGAHLVWLVELFTLFCGIAPLDILPQLGLGGSSASLFYILLNPFAIGLVAAFIFVDVSWPFISTGQGIRRALLAWLGTLACFLVLLMLYNSVVPQQPIFARCIEFCNPNPVVLYSNTWFIWIPIGLILAVVGGLVGVGLCAVMLKQKNG